MSLLSRALRGVRPTLGLALIATLLSGCDEGPSSPVVMTAAGDASAAAAIAANAAATSPYFPVDTGFDPRLDGVAFGNDGTIAYVDTSGGGDCAGIATLSALWFARWQRVGGERLREKFPGDTPILHDMALVAQVQQYENYEVEEIAPVTSGARATGERILRALHATRQPQLLVIVMHDPRTGEDSAHEVLVTGYRDGHFVIYDPNHPNNPVNLDFGPQGFGRFRWWNGQPMGSFYDQVVRVATFSPTDVGGDQALERIHAETSRPQNQNPNDVSLTRADLVEGRLQVEGQIANYRPRRKREVQITVDGQEIPARVHVTSRGRFSAVLDPLYFLPKYMRPEGVLLQAHVVVRDRDGNYAGGAAVPEVVVQPVSRGFVSRFATADPRPATSQPR
ncbi:MAG: hypothetical protein ACAI25_02500 [Planctomycetota bacterium]